ncbi:MAG: hybrid sensor histidine kinase/response regulator [Burkholderiaceae bacterium]|nr:hybrid sensor histidine kinase/response regulator [Burkholderiaceae bacterium]
MNTQPNRRILLIDDTPAIHEDFRKILGQPQDSDFDAAEAALFGLAPRPPAVEFELDSAYQGEQGVAMAAQALAAGRPYAMAFVDMRMPPGCDGVETIERLWREDALLQVVVCTAYSDHAWDTLLARLDAGDRLLILKKPFDPIEVWQLACTLTAKRQLTRQVALKMADLEATIQARTFDLRRANEVLQAEISERKLLESQLVQSEKLASIGQLAAGVAHEINNPVGFVLSNVGILGGYFDALLKMNAAYEEACGALAPAAVAGLNNLRASLELDYLKEDLPPLMRETRDGIVRVRQIVQDLRDFSRIDASADWQWSDLHQCIDTTLNIVNSEIKYKADVVKQYGTLPVVECLPSQLNQVVMNLVLNAAHAIGDGRGLITIRTGSGDGQVWIEVADTGCGIADEHLSRIFDPFFTTKPVGKGAGLGLSVSYGIVQKHQGQIRVHSAPGKGSSFRVTLPVRQRP